MRGTNLAFRSGTALRRWLVGVALVLAAALLPATGAAALDLPDVAAPVVETVAPVVEPVDEAVTPVAEPAEEAAAPLVEPVAEAVAPVVEPVEEIPAAVTEVARGACGPDCG